MKAEEPSAVFRAFADATRLRILNLLLAEKEICVCDLTEVLGVVQPKVSRHLAVLRQARLVEVRSEGKWKFYALADAVSPLHGSLIRCVRGCLGEVPDLARDRERLRGIEMRLRCR